MALLVGGALALVFLDLPWSAVVIGVLVVFEFIEFRIWRWAVHRRPLGGTAGLVGATGSMIDGSRVRIQGTTYTAKTEDAAPGDQVIVERADGMTLVVRRSG